MTVSSTVDRIANYCMAVMACACFSLWAIDSYIVNPKHTQDTQNIKNAAPKSTTTTRKDSAQATGGGDSRASASKVAAQKSNKAKSTTKTSNAKPKSRVEGSPITDADRFAWDRHYYKLMYDKYYQDAYKILGLDDATNEALRDLLTEKIMAVEKAQEERSGKGESTYEDDVNRAKPVALEYDEKISALLGPEKFALLSEFETTLPQRDQISRFRAELEFSGEPLSVEQEMALLPAIDKYLSLHPYEEEGVKTWARMNPRSSILVVDVSGKNEIIFKDVLTPGQIETLTGAYNRMSTLISKGATLRNLGLR